MTDLRRPVHLAVLVGVSTAAYAAALAGVAALQSTSDQALIADRAPIADAADAAADYHRRLESAVDAAARRYDVLAAGYRGIGAGVGALESAIDDLATRVQVVADTARSLPTRIDLPTVKALPAARPAARPATHGTSGASG